MEKIKGTKCEFGFVVEYTETENLSEPYASVVCGSGCGLVFDRSADYGNEGKYIYGPGNSYGASGGEKDYLSGSHGSPQVCGQGSV